MSTVHRVRGLRLAEGGELLPDHAVAITGGRFAAIGPYEEVLAQAGPHARVRAWDGVLTPGRYEPDAAALLEAAYYPDPREAAELGTEPLTGEALAALEMTDARWGGSARRGVQRLFAAGTTALSGTFTRPAVRTAVERSGIRVLPAPRPRPLVLTGAADFAVFAEDGGALVTVLGGRLVFRRG
ncbi:imidazolonepropionase-like domain-containing protein [Streptomyces klenkii]|uniref:imidazolonepropionase-like domain-containing protein n=1 Tax=Streptomyces klenkii TaxID=1420899 RepID=UPI0034263B7E